MAQARPLNQQDGEYRLGILAGTGPFSSASFLERFMRRAASRFGLTQDHAFPRITLETVPFDFDGIHVHPEQMLASLRNSIGSLYRAGVQLCGLACNTAHVVYPQLSRDSPVPIVNMAEESAATIPGFGRRVMLLASRPTTESCIYQKALSANGHTALTGPFQSSVDELLCKIRLAPTSTASFIRDIKRHAAKIGADTILVACPELSSLIRFASVASISVIDASDILIDRLLDAWATQRSILNSGRTDGIVVSRNPDDLDLDYVWEALRSTYGQTHESRSQVVSSFLASTPFSARHNGRLCGFARLITDGMTFGYLCDIFIDEKYRGNGLATHLVGQISAYCKARGLRQLLLATHASHAHYRNFGFQVVPADRFMEFVGHGTQEYPTTL